MDSSSIHTVFISSTFEDLREERAEVQKAILRLRCMPIGMELFPSADDDAWGFIKRQIEHCDYYVLIVAGRYGSVDKDGISFTEKEYRFARELKKPILVFIRSNRENLPPEKRESDLAKDARLTLFIDELKNARLARLFESHHQLGGDAYYSLTELRNTRPMPGYVRRAGDGHDAAETAYLAEIKRLGDRNEELLATNETLRSENDRLRRNLEWQQAQAKIRIPEEPHALTPFSGYEDIIIVDFTILQSGKLFPVEQHPIEFGLLFLVSVSFLGLVADEFQDALKSAIRALKHERHPPPDHRETRRLTADRLPQELKDLTLITRKDQGKGWKLTYRGIEQFDIIKALYNYDPMARRMTAAPA